MKKEKRFEIVYTQCNPTETISILLDKTTGRQFLVVDTERGIAVTAMKE